jgi:hypothetical protein
VFLTNFISEANFVEVRWTKPKFENIFSFLLTRNLIMSITFEQKGTYNIGDIAVGTSLTTCMRCVNFDKDGEPLFRRIVEVAELGHPNTGVIPHELIYHARFNGTANYEVHLRNSETDTNWTKMSSLGEGPLTLAQAEMAKHNLELYGIVTKIMHVNDAKI